MGQHFWLVNQPTVEQLSANRQIALTNIIFTRSITQDVRIRARADGLFELELRGLPNCSRVQIPALELNAGGQEPEAYRRAQEKAYHSLLSKLKYANAFKACLTSAMSYVQAHAIGIDQPELPSDYIPLDGPEVFDRGITNNGHPYLDKRLKACYASLLEISNDQLSQRSIVKYETLEFAAKQFEEVVNVGEDFALLVDLLYHQHHLYSCHRFSECLIGAWAIIETALHHQWRAYLKRCHNSVNPISVRRMEKLTGRDFTASIIQETLNLAGQLPNDNYVDIYQIRKVRNDWIHKLRPVSSDKASTALQLCRKMVNATWGVDLFLCISYGYAN